jgi:hypothetical protein
LKAISYNKIAKAFTNEVIRNEQIIKTMSSPITSIFIENIGNNITPKAIVKLFEDMRIAIVKKVTVFPEFNQIQKKMNYGAYIAVDWMDTETAYKFINCVKHPKKIARVFYTDTDYWIVKPNPVPAFTSESFTSKWTFKFENPMDKVFKEIMDEEQDYILQQLEEGELAVSY